MADPVRFVCGNREILVPLVCLHTCEAQHCMSQHWDFNPSTSDMWIPISSAADEDLQWWMLGHNVRIGDRVIPKYPDPQWFTYALVGVHNGTP